MASIFTVGVTSAQYERAKVREAEMTQHVIEQYGREHLNNSIKEGMGVFVGLLGEEIIKSLYGFQSSSGDDIYHYDLLDPVFLGKIDVKTKLQNWGGTPQRHYNATVCDANIHQRCDYYCFVRVRSDYQFAWVLGVLPKHLFLSRATFAARGDVDPTSRSGWTFAWDCHNVQVRDLWTLPQDPLELSVIVEKAKHAELAFST